MKKKEKNLLCQKNKTLSDKYYSSIELLYQTFYP